MNYYTTDRNEIIKYLNTYENNKSPSYCNFIIKQLSGIYNYIDCMLVHCGKSYSGCYAISNNRTTCKKVLDEEKKLAAVLACNGLGVFLLEENNNPGTHPDAIINGAVVDFKTLDAESEKELGHHTIRNRYWDAVKKQFSLGAVFYVKNISDKYILKLVKNDIECFTGDFILFYHENSNSLQLVYLDKLRNACYCKKYHKLNNYQNHKNDSFNKK